MGASLFFIKAVVIVAICMILLFHKIFWRDII